MTTAARNRRPGQNPLSLRARVLIRLIVLAPILTFFVASILQLAKLVRVVNGDIANIVASVLHQTLNHEFKIGRISYLQPGVIRIDNVAVSSKSSWAASGGEAGLTVRQVVVKYDFNELLSNPASVANCIRTITADHPTALVERYSQKTFNFSDLITKKKHKHAKPFIAKIFVVQGTVHYRDFTAPLDPNGRAAYNTVSRLDGNVDCDSDYLITFSGRGVGSGRFASVSASGNISRRQPLQYTIDGSVTDGDASYWVRFLRLVPQARVVAGRADVRFTLLVPPASNPPPAIPRVGHDLIVMGEGVARGGVVNWLDRTYLEQPITDINGKFSFTDTEVNANGSVSIAGQPIGVAGTVGIVPTTGVQTSKTLPPPPTISLALQSRSLDVSRLAGAFRNVNIPPGITLSSAAGRVQARGLATDPVVTGDVEIGAIALAGNRATGVRAKILYAHKKLGIKSAQFGVNGTGRASIVAAADLTHSKPAYTASGHVEGVDLAALRLPTQPAVKTARGHMKPISVAGKLAADFIAKDDGSGAHVISNVEVAGGRVSNTPVRALRGRVIWNENRSVDLDKVVVEAAGGRALVSGSISLKKQRPELELTINAADVSLGPAIAPFSPVDVGGIAYYNGRLAGPIDNPTATGTIHLFRAHYARYDADVVRGDVTVNRDDVRIYDLHVQRFPADADVAGNITGIESGRPKLALKASLRGAQLDDIDQLLGENGRKRAESLLPIGATPSNIATAFAGLQGEVDGNFTIGGDLQTPTVVGHVNLKDITAGGNHIDTAQSDIAVTDQEVRMRRIVLRSGKATATGELAWWPHTGKVQSVVAGSDIEIYRFRSFYGPYADIRGSFNFSGSIAGTITNPVVTFGVVADDVSIDGQHLAQFTGFGKYENGVLSSDSGPWDFTLLVPPTPGVTTATEQIDYSLDKFEMTAPALVGRKGNPTFDIAAHIPMESPEHLSHIIDTLRGSKFAAMPAVENVVAQYEHLPKPTDAVIAAPSITVKGDASNLTAHANVSITNVVSGPNHIASLDAVLNYDTRPGQSLSGTVAVNDILVDGISINSVNLAGGYENGNKTITVNDLNVRYADAYIDVNGTAALDGDINADVDVSNLPLSIFNSFMPRSRQLSGKIGTFSAIVTGPTRSPNMQASISIENPDIAPTEIVTASAAPVKPATVSTAVSNKIDEIKSETISISSPVPGGSKILSVGDLGAFRQGARLASLSGSIPFRWNRLKWDNLSSMLAALPNDQPLHAQLTISDLSILRLVSNSVDPARTGGTLVATVDGNEAGHPSPLEGSIQLTNGSIGILGPLVDVNAVTHLGTPTTIDTSLQDINANISFDLTGARIVSFTGKSSVKGDFSLAGGVKFGSDANLDLSIALNSFEFNEHTGKSLLTKLYSSAAQGKITGAVAITGPFNSPKIANPITKRIVISDASIGIPSAPAQTGASKSTYPIDPKFEIHLAIGGSGKTVSVKNALLNTDVSGTADIGGTLSGPIFDSDLVVNRGRVTLVGPVLRITPGGTIKLHYPTPNSDNTPGAEQFVLSEVVDVTATTTISASPADLAQGTSSIAGTMGGGAAVGSLTSADTQRTEYHIKVIVIGDLTDKNLKPDYSSEPRLDPSQILLLLTPQTALLGILRGGSGTGDIVAQQLAAIVNSVGIGMLLDPVETNIAQALGLSSFVVDYSPDAPVVVTLSKPLGHRLEVTFLRAFGSRAPGAVNSLLYDPQYQVKLSYNIWRRLRLSVSTDDQQNNTVELEGVLGF